MNIFCTSDDPIISARNLDDKRVNKMIVESAQMLSTGLRRQGAEDALLYKLAFQNHPCSIWARMTQGNFLWLSIHALGLCDVYRSVYNREHKTEKVIRKCVDLMDAYIFGGPQTPFANCSLYKGKVDVLLAYQTTMNVKWARDKNRPTWHNRNKPDWYRNLG